MRWVFRLLPLVMLLLGYWASVNALISVPPPDLRRVAPVALPVPMQIAISGGDRYLAANVAGFRTVVGLAEILDKQDARAFAARLQQDVAWLNAGHEDNYYLAAGLLSGTVHHAAVQRILAAAADARPFDFQPAFFYAFNLMYYERRYAEAGQWMMRAGLADADEENRAVLHKIAVRWTQRGEDPARVAEMLTAMAEQSRSRVLRDYTLKRAAQARDLATLNDAVRRFVSDRNRPPASLEELVQAGLLTSVPNDPVGGGYELDGAGRPASRPLGKGGSK